MALASDLGHQPGSADDASQDLKIIPWENFQNSLANFCGAVSVNKQLQAKREALAQKLEAVTAIRKESLHRIGELEALKAKLKQKELVLENARVSLQERSEDVAIAKDKFLPSARSLLAADRALRGAQSRLQDASRLLRGEGGCGQLLHLRNKLGARRRLMIAQIMALYPITPCSTTNCSSQRKHSANLVLQGSESSSKESQSVPDVEKTDTLPMTIGGLHVLAPLNTKPGLYNEQTDYAEESATALGYVAHAVSLLATFLDVPLRYPVRLGASRSYIQDNAPAVEHASAEAGTDSAGFSHGGTRKGVTEFPLFSEGQDPTRSAYAVFLLNKDLEQVLNYLGAESVGPRHTLPNLNKIIQLVCSRACSVA